MKKMPTWIVRALYWCAAVAILAWGSYKRFQLPLTPFADLDSWHFVNPALSALSGDGFHHTEGGSFLYPAFLLGLLRVNPHFGIITIVQHIMGILCGILALLAWRRIRVFYPDALVPRWAHETIGLALMALSLLAGTRVLYEHSLRPEAVTCFFAALNFLFMLEFMRVRFIEKRSSPYGLAMGGLTIVNSFLLFLLKPSYGLTMFFATLPIWGSLFSRKEPWTQKCLLAVPALCVVMSLWLFEHRLSQEDKGGKEFLAATLFTIHANIIADQMQDDLAQPGPLRFDREWLAGIHAKLREEIEKSRLGRPWRTLGFNPDLLLFQDSICRQISSDIHNRNERAAFYYYYYRRAFRKRPWQMIGKITREMRQFYSFDGAYREFREPYKLSSIYTNSGLAFRYHSAPVERSPIGKEYLETCAAESANPSQLAQSGWVMAALDILSNLYIPALLGSFAVALGSLFHEGLRRRCGLLNILAFLFFSYNFGNCIATSIVHSLSITRYIQAQFVCTLFSETVGLLSVLEAGLWWILSKRELRTES